MVDRNISIFMSCKLLIILNVVHYLSQFHSTFHKRIMIGYTSKNLFTHFLQRVLTQLKRQLIVFQLKAKLYMQYCVISVQQQRNQWTAVFRREPHYLTLCSRTHGRNSKGNIVTTQLDYHFKYLWVTRIKSKSPTNADLRLFSLSRNISRSFSRPPYLLCAA